MRELMEVQVEEEDFFYSLSFDIDDFVGDGIWWLQIYDSSEQIIYDKPFAASNQCFSKNDVTQAVSEGLDLMRLT